MEDGSNLMEIDWGPNHNTTYKLHLPNTSHVYHLNKFIHRHETNNPGLSLKEIDWGPKHVNLGVHHSSIFLYIQQINHDGKHSNNIQKEIIFHPLDCGEKNKKYTSQHLENLVNYFCMSFSIFDMYYALFFNCHCLESC